MTSTIITLNINRESSSLSPPRLCFLSLKERDQVRRFITLIDALYESHAKVICTAALDPISLPLDV